MGWASGSELFGSLIRTMRKHVPDAKVRTKVYKAMIKAFEDADWDTQDECEGMDPAFDKALGRRDEE